MSTRKVIPIFLIVIFSGIFANRADALPLPAGLGPVDLALRVTDIQSITLTYHESYLGGGADNSAQITVSGDYLVSGTKSIPLAEAGQMLRGLRVLYPSPRAVTFLAWTDDYPFVQATIKLKDGRQIAASSTSQYPKAVPWNVWVSQTDTNQGGASLLGSYVLLNEEFHAGVSNIWQKLFGEEFPRGYGFDEDYIPQNETEVFYVPAGYGGFTAYGGKADVESTALVALGPFVTVLNQNPVLAQFFQAGYSLFDAAFDITVRISDRRPIRYSGTIALRAPESRDVIVTTADIDLSSGTAVVTTPLAWEDATSAIEARKSHASLKSVSGFLPELVYLTDLRTDLDERSRGLECEKFGVIKPDYRVDALLTDMGDKRLTFYHFPILDSWTVDASFRRTGGWWRDSVVEGVLKHWFPKDLQNLPVGEIEGLYTTVGIALREGAGDRNPDLLSTIISAFPKGSDIYEANPDIDGDKSYVQIDGRLLIPTESYGAPEIVPCKEVIEDSEDENLLQWIKVPSPENQPRKDLHGAGSTDKAWTPAFSLPGGSQSNVNWTAIASSKPGYLHLLWTTHAGVYYSEGWADGTGWTEPQRLDSSSWSVEIHTNKAGEVHLLWSASNPTGTFHVWKNAAGEWQAPEFWHDAGYFSDVVLDENGIMHLAWKRYGGWDQEFFYAEWDSQNGLSKPENLSRRKGDIGNYSIRLREDAQGQIHAVWGHPLSGQQYVDPLSGEVYDKAGLFYATRKPEGGWTKPVQLGEFAPFAYAMGFDFAPDGSPVVLWQSANGLESRVKGASAWSTSSLLQKIDLPKTPDEFGPGRWGEATIDIETLRDEQGALRAVWTNKVKGIYQSEFSSRWSAASLILEEEGLYGMEAASGQGGILQLLYFTKDGYLRNTAFDGKTLHSEGMGMVYSGYGLPEASMVVDQAGFVYVLGLPRSPQWKVFIPAGGSAWIERMAEVTTIASTPQMQLGNATPGMNLATPSRTPIRLETVPPQAPTVISEGNKAMDYVLPLAAIVCVVGVVGASIIGLIIIRRGRSVKRLV